MICTDWRDAPASEISRLFHAEGQRWLEVLDWNAAASFAIVEEGRRNGVVPGWIARNTDGRPLGWTYYILQDGALQIGGVAASRPAVVRRLIASVMGSAEASLARRLSCFVLPEGPSLASALARERFELSESRYLSAPLTSTDTACARHHVSRAQGIRGWTPADLAPAVRLLAEAYCGVPGSGCFAPEGTIEQWARYAVQLIRIPACGEFDPSLSFVATGRRATELAGVVLTTRISSSAAHVVQLAVSAAARRRGCAAALLDAARAAAAQSGLTTVTLMVDADNGPAGALYQRAGFTERARFLYGSRPARTRAAASVLESSDRLEVPAPRAAYPCRSTSDGPALPGEMTRR